MPIRPATKKKVATIELTSEDEEKIKQIVLLSLSGLMIFLAGFVWRFQRMKL